MFHLKFFYILFLENYETGGYSMTYSYLLMKSGI